MKDFDFRVLTLFDKHELHDSLYWNVDHESVELEWWVLCNDLFLWGCADTEQITPDTIDLLEQAIEDCIAIDEYATHDGLNLYCCRRRKMRPQGAAYPHTGELDGLFNACGPERDIGFGNPYTPQGYRK